MRVSVHFYSYFKDLTGRGETLEQLFERATIADLFRQLSQKFPQLEPMKKSMLVAVGLDYQTWDYVLSEGDEVSFFPPVQGG